MPASSGVKGNPAAKRMGNKNLQARRARSWARAQVKKAANILRAKEAFEANEVYRKAGLLTPYQERRKAQREEYEAAKAAKAGKE